MPTNNHFSDKMQGCKILFKSISKIQAPLWQDPFFRKRGRTWAKIKSVCSKENYQICLWPGYHSPNINFPPYMALRIYRWATWCLSSKVLTLTSRSRATIVCNELVCTSILQLSNFHLHPLAHSWETDLSKLEKEWLWGVGWNLHWTLICPCSNPFVHSWNIDLYKIAKIFKQKKACYLDLEVTKGGRAGTEQIIELIRKHTCYNFICPTFSWHWSL